jgi:hypothetical protein
MKRVKADDPMALWYSGKRDHMGGSYEIAFDYLMTRAAELGVATAHHMPCLAYITMVRVLRWT